MIGQPNRASMGPNLGSPHASGVPFIPQVTDLARPVPVGSTNWWRGAVIGAGAVALALAILAALWLLARPLSLLLAAIVLAEAVAPVVARLEHRLPRALAVVGVYLSLALALGGIAWAVVPPLIGQTSALITDAPMLVERTRGLAERWNPGGGGLLVGSMQSTVTRLGGALLALPFAIISSITEIVLVLVMSAYWLVAAPALRRFALSLVPEGDREQVAAVLDEMGRTVGGYVRAAVIHMPIVGVIVYVGLLTIGVSFPLVLALVAAVGELIPLLGPFIAAVPAVAIALLHSPGQAVTVLVFYVVVQQLESNILMPNIMRRQADIPPLLALFALFAGAEIGGVLGALIAIPLAGALRVLVVRLIAPAVRRWTGAGGSVAGSAGDAGA